MKSSEDQTPSQDAAAAQAPARLGSPARRRLLRAGSAAVPALLALKSTPVMACNCKLPSGFSVSGNQSQENGAACASPGYKPSYWKTNCDSGGTYYTGSGSSCKKTDNFSKYFTRGTYTDKTLHSCLSTSSQTDHQAMAVACYLQGCAEGGSHFPTATTIKNVWNYGVVGGSYPVPGTSMVWDKSACLNYLKYLTGQTLG